MTDPDLLLRVLRGFASTMAGSYDITEVLFDLCESATELLDAQGAGVTVADDGMLRFVTATNESIRDIEQVQEDEQEGPCMEALRSHQPVMAEDLEALNRWPVYRRVAEQSGVRSVIGVPLGFNARTLGALNIYRAEPGPWSPTQISAATTLANMATSYLIHTSELQRAHQLSEQLQEALDSRVVIEQAKGLLAGEMGISVDSAFDLLRKHARSRNAKLAVVADAVLRLGLRPSPSQHEG